MASCCALRAPHLNVAKVVRIRVLIQVSIRGAPPLEWPAFKRGSFLSFEQIAIHGVAFFPQRVHGPCSVSAGLFFFGGLSLMKGNLLFFPPPQFFFSPRQRSISCATVEGNFAYMLSRPSSGTSVSLQPPTSLQ